MKNVTETASDLRYSNAVLIIPILCALFAPLLPLVSVAIVSLTTFRLKHWQAAILYVASGMFGIFASLTYAVFAGAGATAAAFHGLVLTVAIIASFLIIIDPARTKMVGKVGLGMMAISAVVGCWSILHGVALAVNAYTISDGRAYCIAQHGDETSIRQLIDLRGLSFYTVRSGFKDYHSWYFHGILLVDLGGEAKVYNWSMRRMRFEPVQNLDVLPVDPGSDCAPEPDFLQSVPFVKAPF